MLRELFNNKWVGFILLMAVFFAMSVSCEPIPDAHATGAYSESNLYNMKNIQPLSDKKQKKVMK